MTPSSQDRNATNAKLRTKLWPTTTNYSCSTITFIVTGGEQVQRCKNVEITVKYDTMIEWTDAGMIMIAVLANGEGSNRCDKTKKYRSGMKFQSYVYDDSIDPTDDSILHISPAKHSIAILPVSNVTAPGMYRNVKSPSGTGNRLNVITVVIAVLLRSVWINLNNDNDVDGCNKNSCDISWDDAGASSNKYTVTNDEKMNKKLNDNDSEYATSWTQLIVPVKVSVMSQQYIEKYDLSKQTSSSLCFLSIETKIWTIRLAFIAWMTKKQNDMKTKNWNHLSDTNKNRDDGTTLEIRPNLTSLVMRDDYHDDYNRFNTVTTNNNIIDDNNDEESQRLETNGKIILTLQQSTIVVHQQQHHPNLCENSCRNRRRASPTMSGNSPLRNIVMHTRTMRPFLFIIMCFVSMHVVDAQVGGSLLSWLCQRRLLSQLEMCLPYKTTPTPTYAPTSMNDPSPTTTAAPSVVSLACDDRKIRTATDLQAAIDKATATTSISTIIEVCQELIIVPPLFNVSRNNGYDFFGFRLDYKNIIMKCSRKSVSGNQGFCSLQGLGGAGLFYVNNSTLTINGFILVDGGSEIHSAGGAIYKTNNSYVELVDSVIKDNRALAGGGIYSNNTNDLEARLFAADASNDNNYGQLVLSNTEFIGNKAIYGGAIQASNTWIRGTYVKFQQNEGRIFGGAIALLVKCIAFFTDSLFEDNTATDGGGFFSNYTQDPGRVFDDSTSNMGQIELVDTIFIGNKATNGGAIQAANTWILGSNVTFLKNEGRLLGGAITLIRKCFAFFTNSSFEDNSGADGGGINYSNYSQDPGRVFDDPTKNMGRIELFDTAFIRNKAINGGAIHASNTLISGSNVNFTQNEGSRFGGAIGIYGKCIAHINDTIFDNNYARGFGGAVYTDDDAQATFLRPRFFRNAAGFSSVIDIIGRSKVEITDGIVRNNLLNDTRQTQFNVGDLNVLESLQNASAIRCSSRNGIALKRTLFSNNKISVYYEAPEAPELQQDTIATISRSSFNTNISIEPYDTANLFVDGNGTADCSNITYCGDTGLRVSDGGDAVTNCGQLGSSSEIIQPGDGVCYNRVTKCFESTDELRRAVRIYFRGDLRGIVKKKYGDPIGSWCVDDIFDFSFLFNGYKFEGNDDVYFNPQATQFNEDLSAWNTSSAINMIFMFANTSFNQDISSWDVSKVKDMQGMLYRSAFNGDISRWNVSAVQDMRGMFALTPFNQSLDPWNVSAVTDMLGMFLEAESFTSNLTNWQVGSVTTMTGMFTKAKLFNGNLERWNVSAVIDMSYMFAYAESFTGNLTNWNVASVTTMKGMFAGALSFAGGNLSKWNVSSVTTMREMFYKASLFIGHVDGWDVSAVTDMSSMFKQAEKFTGTLKNWNVASVTTMEEMFVEAKLFNDMLETWNVSSVTTMALMFNGAESFTGRLINWDVSAVKNMSAMFYQAKLFNGTLKNWNVSSVTDMSLMFSGAESFSGGKLSNWNVAKVTTMKEMFYEAKSFRGVMDGWDVSAVIDMSYMFYGAESFSGGSLKNWNVVRVTTMKGMFNRARMFNGNLKNWNVASVNDMSYMFSRAESFTDGALTNWNVARVTTMGAMFSYATMFNGNLELWNVSAVIVMDEMFLEAQSFTGNLTNWDVGLVTSMKNMFFDAKLFNGNLKGWDVSAVTSMEFMFHGAESFSDGNLTNWNVGAVTSMKAMFEGARLFNGDVEGWDVSAVDDMSYMFRGAESFAGSLKNWRVTSVITMTGMFDTAIMFNGNLDGWGVSAVTRMLHMFRGAKLFNGELDGWDVSAVNDMWHMFDGAESFAGSLKNWNVSKVTDMSGMFSGAKLFNGDVGGWDVSSVIAMNEMFRNASTFQQNLCPWGKVLNKGTSTTSMFLAATSCPTTKDPVLTRIPAGPFCYRCI